LVQGSSDADGINRGQIVGDIFIPGDIAYHAFLYSRGHVQDLGTLGGASSVAFGINDLGQIVGEATTFGSEVYHAFLYSRGHMQDLGTLGGASSVAFGINNRGQIVGEVHFIYINGREAEHAILYSEGKLQDLNNLLAPDSGWILSSATGINERGQIAGEGTIKGQTHAFLLTPRLGR
jgi:probable HAF family extracellular repeat protein